MTRTRSRPRGRSRLAAAAASLAAVGVLLTPAAASAHSLDSSTISVHVGEDSTDATVTVALATLDEALGTDWTAEEVAEHADEVTAYLADHLTVTGTDGEEWAETWSDLTVETVEGIESVSVDVALDDGGADPSSFTLSYDAVIEADDSHEAVVVLTDAAGDVSTPGVIDADHPALRLGDAADVGVVDLARLGFEHVLAGADHLLLLVTLLLVAPVVVVAGRWRRRDGVVPTARKLLGVATAFTVGHSLTLAACALGWVSPPTTVVEVLIAVSVGVSAVHAIRPLTRHGEELIAGGFGLVHGLAFAGILTDLGLGGSTSLLALLAFNVGVELAQVAVIALLVPSLYVASRTRAYPAVRVTGAALALVASVCWALDRLGLLADPLGGVEAVLVDHLLLAAIGVAGVAAACWLADRRRSLPSEECPTPISPTSSAPAPARRTTRTWSRA